MLIFCSWCKKFMGEKEPKWDKIISHGLCPDCEKKFFPIDKKEPPKSKD